MAQKKVIVIDQNQIQVDVASEESLILLKRIVKLLESNATVDSANRQLIAIATIPTTTVTGTVSINQIPTYGWENMDRARQSYAQGIRANLQWITTA